ncbi:MAG: hypothetical protein R3Y11_07885 [Pseudomonadota bacterium]
MPRNQAKNITVNACARSFSAKDMGIVDGPPVHLTTLGAYVDFLPPWIARKRVDWFTGGAFTPKKLANDDGLGTGPLVRTKVGDTVVYPTPYFLEYLERKGVHTVIVPQI